MFDIINLFKSFDKYAQFSDKDGNNLYKYEFDVEEAL